MRGRLSGLAGKLLRRHPELLLLDLAAQRLPALGLALELLAALRHGAVLPTLLHAAHRLLPGRKLLLLLLLLLLLRVAAHLLRGVLHFAAGRGVTTRSESHEAEGASANTPSAWDQINQQESTRSERNQRLEGSHLEDVDLAATGRGRERIDRLKIES